MTKKHRKKRISNPYTENVNSIREIYKPIIKNARDELRVLQEQQMLIENKIKKLQIAISIPDNLIDDQYRIASQKLSKIVNELVNGFFDHLVNSNSIDKFDIEYYQKEAEKELEKHADLVKFCATDPDSAMCCVCMDLPLNKFEHWRWDTVFKEYYNDIWYKNHHANKQFKFVLNAKCRFNFSPFKYDKNKLDDDVKCSLTTQYIDSIVESVFENLPWWEPMLKTVINSYLDSDSIEVPKVKNLYLKDIVTGRYPYSNFHF